MRTGEKPNCNPATVYRYITSYAGFKDIFKEFIDVQNMCFSF